MPTILDITTFAYQTGTLTIAAGDTTAVFTGSSLTSAVKDGDYLLAGGSLSPIETVTDDTHAELFTEWAGADVTDGTYVILKASLLRYHTALIGYDAATFISMLDGTAVWYAVEGSEPDPSIGEEGQRALKSNVTPWKQWLRTGGIWVEQAGSPGGQGDPGEPGATWIVQASEPSTDFPTNSLWLDSDSADLDVYQLGGSPLDWVDTGINLKGATGAAGLGVPVGGTTGQVLSKISGTDNDTAWVDAPQSLPTGGTIGQVLTKSSSTDGDATWSDPSGDIAGDTHAATAKATPIDADELALVDSASTPSAFGLKKITWANIKSSVANWLISTGRIRDVLTADRAYYVGFNIPVPSISIASPAVVSSTAHGLAAGSPVVFDVPLNTTVATVTIASPGVVTFSNHGFAAGRPILFRTTGALPTGITAGTTYYVISTGLTTNTFQFATTAGGSAVNTSGSQSGVHEVSTVGSLPTGITAGATYYVIAAGLTSNSFEISATLGGSAVNTSGTVTGTPIYRAYTGNDASDGKSNSAAGAFLTIQKSLNVASLLDINIFSVNINLAGGLYTAGAAIAAPWLGSGSVNLVGNTTTPANVLVDVGASANPFSVSGGGYIVISGLELRGNIGLLSQRGSRIYISTAVRFGACAAYHMYANSGQIVVFGGYTISGNAAAHLNSDAGGSITSAGLAISLIGVPAFSSAYAIAGGVGSAIIGYSCTFTGTATGSRYSVGQGALINSNGGGTSYFPGNAAGSGTNFSVSPWGLYQ